eukprot:TRINITY_DN15314_c0_g1_i1.p1 TRINITY_DN15314_c0_g1~~TRINITY_DN15314_c0_g1_i1.p1  ORF type:complete len:828 (+),score=168.25 TRINITY_DN15314_c0_g1_i1:159-2642(+)
MRRQSSGMDSSSDKFSLSRLERVFRSLDKTSHVTDENKASIIETFREMVELMVWGDQHSDEFFSFFLENKMMTLFDKFLRFDCSIHVKTQLIQTLSMMIQNIRNEKSLYFLLSSHYINNILSGLEDFEDEELLANFVMLSKTLSFKLNYIPVDLFFNRAKKEFPLFTQSVRFIDHQEPLVRASARTTTLNLLKLSNEKDPELTKYYLDHVEFERFSRFLRDEMLHLQNRDESTDMSSRCLDHLYYANDIFSLKSQEISTALFDALRDIFYAPVIESFKLFLQPVSTKSEKSGKIGKSEKSEKSEKDDARAGESVQDTSRKQEFSPSIALYILCNSMIIVGFAPLVNHLANEVLQESGDAFRNMLERLSPSDPSYTHLLGFILGVVCHENIDPAILRRAELLPRSKIRYKRLVQDLVMSPASEDPKRRSTLKTPTSASKPTPSPTFTSADKGSSLFGPASHLAASGMFLHGMATIGPRDGTTRSPTLPPSRSSPDVSPRKRISIDEAIGGGTLFDDTLQQPSPSDDYPTGFVNMLLEKFSLGVPTRLGTLHAGLRVVLILVRGDGQVLIPSLHTLFRSVHLRLNQFFKKHTGTAIRFFEKAYDEFMNVYDMKNETLFGEITTSRSLVMSKGSNSIELWKRLPTSETERYRFELHALFLLRSAILEIEHLQSDDPKLPVVFREPVWTYGLKLDPFVSNMPCRLFDGGAVERPVHRHVVIEGEHLFFVDEFMVVKDIHPLLYFRVQQDANDASCLNVSCVDGLRPAYGGRLMFETTDHSNEACRIINASVARVSDVYQKIYEDIMTDMSIINSRLISPLLVEGDPTEVRK